MAEKHLHIVCHDIPYPADYGGVIDQFYKIKALSEQNIRVHLHTFEYGRERQPELEKYCASVQYYERMTGHKGLSGHIPYIVCSRSSPALPARLLNDDHPILLEGVHCSFLLTDPRFKDRKIFLRLHNVESLYYRQLARCTSSLFKKIFYLRESNLLKKFEKAVAAKWPILALNEIDADYFIRHFAAKEATALPAFLPFDRISSRQGTGCFCLYHGNLAVDENEKAAEWLLDHVFNDIQLPVLFAGRNPSARLRRIISQFPHACLVADPSEEEMQDIIAKAQIHIVPSFNCTGIKMKLLNALFNGRHCLVNEEAVEGTGLASICHTANDPGDFKEQVLALYEKPFTHYDIERRKEVLMTRYNSLYNVGVLIKQIW
jgi:Glycosyl transferases group 1